ncbi:MAG: hypothetical protein ACRD2G_10650 [Terriglobia bacterium]
MDKLEAEERRALGEALRRSANTYLVEQALRDALSRSYYSVFHLGCVLLGKGYGSHQEFLRDLRNRVGEDDGLWEKMKRVQELRIESDYRFDALRRVYGGDLGKFQRAAFDGLALGREVYDELARRIEKEHQHGSSSGRKD